MKPKREKTVAFERCRRPTCHREAEVMGLCRSDYNAAWSLVQEGATTWAKLEKANKVAPRKRTAKIWLLEGIA